ncbi:MAG: hypothetical protein ACW990_19995 [Promethearchaeota archaeon]|jgi:hypothetical protein
MKNILSSLDSVEILKKGRSIDEINRNQWYGFLNYLSINFSLETVERIVENLGEEEYNAIRVCLILKYIRNED